MEQQQIGNMSLNTCIDFIQQQQLIQKYNHDKSQPREKTFANTYTFKMFVLWMRTWNKKRKMPSIWENLNKSLKKNHFQAVCKFKTMNVEIFEENETNMEVFSIKIPKQECRKIELIKKTLY